jgi:uncharacterized membrane protein
VNEEFFVRRLETFGDIVIGFSLAQLGFSLVVPGHAAALVDHFSWLIAFSWTFAVVCMMWAQHTWTFRYLFVPTPTSLLLNYMKLALIVLLVFAIQVLLRAFESGAPRDVVVANVLYWGCFAAILAISGAIAAIGLRTRGPELPPDVARKARSRIGRTAAAALATTAGIAVGARGDSAVMAQTISAFMAAGIVAGRIGERFFSKPK